MASTLLAMIYYLRVIKLIRDETLRARQLEIEIDFLFFSSDP